MWFGIPNTTPLEVSIAALQRDPIRTARRIKGALMHDDRGGRVARFACTFRALIGKWTAIYVSNPCLVSRCALLIPNYRCI